MRLEESFAFVGVFIICSILWGSVFMSWLIKVITNFFKYKKEPEIKEIPTRSTNGPSTVKNILIVVGHTKSSPGTTTYLGEKEYSYNTKLAKVLEPLLLQSGCNVMTEYRDVGGLRGAYSRGNRIKPDLTLELHLNGFSKVAHGLEVLALKSDPISIEFADLLSDEVAASLGFKERREYNGTDGVLPVVRGDSGYENLKVARDYTTAPIRVLIEPTFVNFKTSESSVIIEDGGKERYAEAIKNAVVKILG
jgi:N-acetylmuramoyl-L-alanine amidase